MNRASATTSSSGDVQHPRLDADVTGEPAPIASNIDRTSLIMPVWQSGTVGAISPSAAPDVVGAFRFMCAPGQLRYDDPIVFAGQPGKSHLHQFFGNMSADAYSTYRSLRSTGDSTCINALNRSAYWIPAMLDGRGEVIRPDYVAIYYKRAPENSSICTQEAKRCAPMPRGLRFVFGYDMVTRKAATGGGYFDCNGPGAIPGHFKTIVDAARGCPIGARLGALISAPSCWDGKRLDSPNHRDHMSYASYGSWGYLRCPNTHQVLIPTFTLSAWYTVDASLRHDGEPSWHLSSDEMPEMTLPPGSTFHADWFGAWDDATLNAWTANCINKMLSCNSGDLGNGLKLRQAKKFALVADPHRVPLPAR